MTPTFAVQDCPGCDLPPGLIYAWHHKRWAYAVRCDNAGCAQPRTTRTNYATNEAAMDAWRAVSQNPEEG